MIARAAVARAGSSPASAPGPLSSLLDNAPGRDPLDPDEGTSYGLLARLWPVIRARCDETFTLVRLSFTAPPGQDVRAPMADLAAWIGAQPGEGALLVIDRRPADGAEHVYGIALVRDRR